MTWQSVMLCLLVLPALLAQTTQGTISGRVTNVQTGAAIYLATVHVENPATNTNLKAVTGPDGYYALPLLPPGTYRIWSTEPCFQRAEIQQQELRVGARLDVNFALRPATDTFSEKTNQLSVLPNGRMVQYFGLDAREVRLLQVDIVGSATTSTHASVSHVFDPTALSRLPLPGRDVYSLLAFLPGVTTDSGSARGLGLAVNGQRPASSNFLLDGIENNNSLITGPLTILAPEAMQEYRASLSSWSAEYGRTSGFLANAITRSGGPQWHGTGYFNAQQDILSASASEPNIRQPGFQLGGPLLRNRLFLSLALDAYRSRSFADPLRIQLPDPALVATNRTIAQLLRDFPTPTTTPGNGFTSTITTAPSISINRLLALARLDYIAEKRRFLLRTIVNRNDWPDFVWYPYKQFQSGLAQPLTGLAFNYTETTGAWTHESRLGYQRSLTAWDRPHPEIPILSIDRGEAPIVLPGSPLLYAFRDSAGTFEWNDNWMRIRGRHTYKLGGGLLLRNRSGILSLNRDGTLRFGACAKECPFLLNQPYELSVALTRTPSNAYLLQRPDPYRQYRNTQFHLFAEDTWRVNSHLTINAGLRYENFGSPSPTASTSNDLNVTLSSGSDFPSRLQSAKLTASTSRQPLWSRDNRNFAGRFGITWAPRSQRAPVFRAAYGLFYDRPFDNLWLVHRNNNSLTANINCSDVTLTGCRIGGDVDAVLRELRSLPSEAVEPISDWLSFIDPKLRNGYSHQFFAGLQQNLSSSLQLEINTLGAPARRLLTSDTVNRANSLDGGRFNDNLPNLYWRSSQGSSAYNALTALARYRTSHAMLQAAYTWSHTIDNQSDALAGSFDSLSFLNLTGSLTTANPASFLRQFDSRADRGNADFDQRHNLVIISYWSLPALSTNKLTTKLTRGWSLAQTAAFRTGFPYSVFTEPPSFTNLFFQRANLRPNTAVYLPRGPDQHGIQLLNPSAFLEPPNESGCHAACSIGNTGRNAFRGPGLWNLDISLSRIFPITETARLTLRGDFFNAFNHGNLNNPDNFFYEDSDTFGKATFGRQGRNTGIPTLAPFREAARQIQLILKLEF